MNKDREITFEITRHIGTIGEQATGFKKELNLVNWNGNQPKYDVRSWDPEHISMTRGITHLLKEIIKYVCKCLYLYSDMI